MYDNLLHCLATCSVANIASYACSILLLKNNNYVIIILVPLCPPWNFRYTSLTNTSISLRWDPPPSDDRSGSVTRYNITFRCANYLHCSSTSTTTQTAYYSNTQLQPGRRYTIAVAPCSSQGCGTTSTVTLNMTTLVSGIHTIPC